VPSLLPDRPEVTKPQLISPETALLNERMNTIPKAKYLSEYDIPSSPAPLTDVEQALDMTSQSSVVAQPIPFFVPQQPQQPAASTSDVYAGTSSQAFDVAQLSATQVSPSEPAVGGSTGATPDFVQSLGLPMFLVGQDTRALQTLANSPSLLSMTVGPNGMYDQTRLLDLVQSLGSANGTQAQQSPPASTYPSTGYSHAQGQSFSQRTGSRGSGSDAANLHVSGYGPSTTQADIIALFSPYVTITEVVMKDKGFSFVNTLDPERANLARETLNGTLLGGTPISIKPAVRRNPSNAVPPPQRQMPPGTPIDTDVNTVRDDRGNPATKNLFVAGYGPGTTEQQIRDLFSQHVAVVGVVNKGSFSFVNTAEREAAVLARQMLMGTEFNGGVLRINFAKETGRLGTSFDVTYNATSGPRRFGPSLSGPHAPHQGSSRPPPGLPFYR